MKFPNWDTKSDGWYIRWTWINSVLIGLVVATDRITGCG